MERSRSLVYCWIIALLYVRFLLNYTVASTSTGPIPTKRLAGPIAGISPLLRFYW